MCVAQGSPSEFDVEFGDRSELEVAMADMTKAAARAEMLARLLAEANKKYNELVSAAVLDRGPSVPCSNKKPLSLSYYVAMS